PSTEILPDQAVEHAVHPLAVAVVGLAADSLAHEAGPLGVAQRPLVEAVDLELEPVVTVVEEEVPLEDARRAVRDPPAPEVGEVQQGSVKAPFVAVSSVKNLRSRAFRGLVSAGP